MEEDESQTKKDEDVNETFLTLENVHKTYLLGIEGIAALRFVFFVDIIQYTVIHIFSGVEVEIKKGEFVMITGTSGGGFVILSFFFIYALSHFCDHQQEHNVKYHGYY